MFVVRRAFRNYNEMIAPGSIVEPGAIKRFKARCRDGSIIEVTEHDFDKWAHYFEVRFGVSLSKNIETEGEQSVEPEGVQPAEPEGVRPVGPEGVQPVKPECVQSVKPEGARLVRVTVRPA